MNSNVFRRREQPSLKSPREIEKMRVAGQMVAKVLMACRDMVAPGVRLSELNEMAHQMMIEMDGEPLFLGYPGPSGAPKFPGVICASVNEEVVHGIPTRDRELVDGDVIGIDCGIRYKNYCGDSAITIPVGRIDEATAKLLAVTQESLYAAIEQMRPGNKLKDVCGAVQAVAEREGFGIVRDYVGHGIGREMHEAPQVPNYVSKGMSDMEMPLKVGHVFAIEPMLNAGTARTRTLADKWTVITHDEQRSAHFEHSIAITAEGPKVLTRRPEESTLPG